MSSKHATQPSTSSRRKSSSKRPLVYSDDDDDDDDNDALVTSTKRARTTDTDVSLSVAATEDDENDMDVDMDDLRDSAQRSLNAAADSRFFLEDPSAQDLPLCADTSKKRKKPMVAKKKPQVLSSGDEACNSHIEHSSVEDALSDLASPLSEASDDFELDTSPRRGASKPKVGATKARAGKTKSGQIKGVRTKGPREREKEREILVKDERKVAPPITTSRASSATAQSQPLELFSNEDLAPSAIDPLPDASQPTKDPLNQTIPRKRKLPPIKKTKTAAGTTGMSTPTATTQKSALLPVQELTKPLLPASEQRKQALTGVRDVDLGDSKVYAELFKGAGGNAPKSGLKNAEERRKELDRMRDEARARRAEEVKFTFDLQSEADKIARFEQRLRTENSTVLHPNFLAAKFRDEWELEKRSRRATPKEEGEA